MSLTPPNILTVLASNVYAADNPLDGITPNYSIFGGDFVAKYQLIIGGVWGLLILGAIVFFLVSLAGVRKAFDSANPQAAKTARGRLIGAAVALGLLIAATVVVGAIIMVAG